MLYALDTLDRLVTATPRAVGRCRGCGAALTPKCGPLVAHHWAHRSGDCDRWAEPDSAWHLAWQACAPADRTEVPIGNHRADIITPDGRVVEVQHSHLPVADIAAREAHYGRMAWLWDAREAYEAERLTLNPRATWAGFRWKHPRKSIASCRRPVFLDLDGERLLRVRKFYQSERFAGWGTVTSADDFRRWLGQPSAPPNASPSRGSAPSSTRRSGGEPMTDRSIPGVRRPLEYPRLDAADRPNADELAEQRRAADPHRNRRAKPRTVTPKETKP